MRIEKPVVVMFEEPQGKSIVCHLWPPEDWTYQHYALVICDLVRHVANAFEVDEDQVWEWVDKERHKPTTKITEPS